jgi:small-conductance mechanosensitive channel
MINAGYLPLFERLWEDLHSAEVLWQIGALAFCLSLAGLLSWQLRKRADKLVSGEGQAVVFGRAGLQRVAFPITALLIVLLVRAALAPWTKVNLLSIAVPLMVSLAIVRMVVYMLRRAFSHSAWLTASERLVATLVWGALALYLSGLSGPLIEMLESVNFKVGKQSVDLWLILHGLAMVAVTILFALWVAGLIEARLATAAQLDSSLRAVLVRVAKAVLTLVALLFSLSLVGIDITALSVFGGALGVGLGFGLQKIASNYVSGFIILLDRSIRLGNLISVDAHTSGVVTQITTRYTVLRSQVGVEFIVPNEFLVANIIQNQTFTDTNVRLVTRVSVGYAADVEAIIALLEDIARQTPRVLAAPAPAAQLLSFGDSGIELELGFWIDDPEEGTGNVRSAINREILRRFRAQNIEIPFPQREVRILRDLPAAAG